MNKYFSTVSEKITKVIFNTHQVKPFYRKGPELSSLVCTAKRDSE